MKKINKKTKNLFWTIIALAFLCVIINLPKSITIANRTFYRPDFSFKIGDNTYKKNLDLKYGLDLAGGASLVFDIKTDKVKSQDLPSALESLKTNIERRINFFGVSESSVQVSKQNNSNRLIVEIPGLENVNQAIQLLGQTAQISFKGETTVAPEATASASFSDVFSVDTGINGSHLVRSTVQINPNNSEPEVSLEFNEQGAKLFEAATKTYLNKRIAIYLDDYPLTFPTVNTIISDGKAVISGSFDLSTAKTMSAQLNAGALPLSIELISQNQVGPTLGQETINRGIKAGIVGLVVVFVFMIANYGKLGLIADISLLIYGLITLSLYRIIPVTLSFSGIVGFILSIGMAVDSNILIFARMKEELRAGKPWDIAMELGFGRAWDSIKDANATTIIIGLILFNPFNWTFLNSSAVVRGFAVTLILGIFVSIFTGVVVSRTLIRVFAREKKEKL